ncbi:hypothetical protein [Amycolatopsis sp. H20-H5]|uniref:hypothetical protein n=1 Tax=Amycolatopsis sp. H20-H5 TaxID=3046309 RepID=UPI002DBA0920|nr:hypothetical protein [Amycolatopsis sp. H20-H5]MEC3975695.1 hypothetical protein [Amycolatopsis sp. H20-H5]
MIVQKLRTNLTARFAKLVDFRVEERVHGFDDRIDELEHATADHRRRLDEAETNLEAARGDLRWTTAQVDRLIPHVAAQEAQLETLRESLALVPPADKPQIAEARSLIEEIQRQHAQIRVRLAGVARYEDRLRRLEDEREPVAR